MSMGDVADLPLKLLLRPDSQGQSKYYITILGAVWSTSLKIRGAGKCDKASCECRIISSQNRIFWVKEKWMTWWSPPHHGAVLPGLAISRQSGYFGKPVAGKNLWLVATMIVAIFGLRIGLFVAIFGILRIGLFVAIFGLEIEMALMWGENRPSFRLKRASSNFFACGSHFWQFHF